MANVPKLHGSLMLPDRTSCITCFRIGYAIIRDLTLGGIVHVYSLDRSVWRNSGANERPHSLQTLREIEK
jgi:hypothetical protein